jgi:hypothetical protein
MLVTTHWPLSVLSGLPFIGHTYRFLATVTYWALLVVTHWPNDSKPLWLSCDYSLALVVLSGLPFIGHTYRFLATVTHWAPCCNHPALFMSKP